MANSSMRVVVPLAFLLLSLTVAVGTEVDCKDSSELLAPCKENQPPEGPVSPSCCSSLESLMLLSPPDLKIACVCISNALSFAPPKIVALVESFPGRCGVKLQFPLNPEADCSSLN